MQAWPTATTILIDDLLKKLNLRKEDVEHSFICEQNKRGAIQDFAGNKSFREAFNQAFKKLNAYYRDTESTLARLRNAGEVAALMLRVKSPFAEHMSPEGLNIDEMTLLLMENVLDTSLTDYTSDQVVKLSVSAIKKPKHIPAHAQDFITINAPWLLEKYRPFVNEQRLKNYFPDVSVHLHFMSNLYDNFNDIRMAWFYQYLGTAPQARLVELPELDM